MARRTSVLTAAVLGVILASAAGVYSYISPASALSDMRDAAQRGDKDRLSELIDFDSVKTGLKDDIRAQMMRSLGEKLKDNVFAGLGVLMVNAMVDPMVDMVVSPSGLTSMIEKGQVQNSKTQQALASPSSIQGTTTQDGMEIRRGYDGFSRYQVAIRQAGTSPDQELTFTMRRQGLFSWKLTRISIPPTLFAEKTRETEQNEGSAAWRPHPTDAGLECRSDAPSLCRMRH